MIFRKSSRSRQIIVQIASKFQILFFGGYRTKNVFWKIWAAWQPYISCWFLKILFAKITRSTHLVYKICRTISGETSNDPSILVHTCSCGIWRESNSCILRKLGQCQNNVLFEGIFREHWVSQLARVKIFLHSINETHGSR